MKSIDEILYQIITHGWTWIWSVSWYWIPAGLGLGLKFGLLKSQIWDPEMRFKAIFRDIGIIFALTLFWSNLNSNSLDDSAAVMGVVLTTIYIIYGLAKNCEDTGGSTESILLILKSTLLTMLSFQGLCGTIFGALITSGLAVLAYKYWFCKEKKTDLFEIILLCAESILLSIIEKMCDIQGIGVFLFIFYEETAIFLLNYIIISIASMCFGENEEIYY